MAEQARDEIEPCEDCGLGVETDPALAGPVLCAGCAENREHAREKDIRSGAEAAEASDLSMAFEASARDDGTEPPGTW